MGEEISVFVSDFYKKFYIGVGEVNGCVGCLNDVVANGCGHVLAGEGVSATAGNAESKTCGGCEVWLEEGECGGTDMFYCCRGGCCGTDGGNSKDVGEYG